VLYSSDSSGSKNPSSSDLKAILKLSWYEIKIDFESDKSALIAYPISSWLNIVAIFKFSISVSCFISFFLIWLLVGRESLGSGEIKDSEIENGEEGVGIADCEKFFLNYINRCAISLHSANLIIDKATVEIANTY
jgi:hypothetical protein